MQLVQVAKPLFSLAPPPEPEVGQGHAEFFLAAAGVQLLYQGPAVPEDGQLMALEPPQGFETEPLAAVPALLQVHLGHQSPAVPDSESVSPGVAKNLGLVLLHDDVHLRQVLGRLGNGVEGSAPAAESSPNRSVQL